MKHQELSRKYGMILHKGGMDPKAARLVARQLSRIPHETYVEPFLGHAAVYRAKQPSKREILNDLDCKERSHAYAMTCGRGKTIRFNDRKPTKACPRLKKAKPRCGNDWKRFLRYDSCKTLFYFDPPWKGVPRGNMMYKHAEGISPEELAAKSRHLKGTVAISYKNSSEARGALCGNGGGFRCHTIKRSMFGSKWSELLAIKKSRC